MAAFYWINHSGSAKYQYAYEDVTLKGYDRSTCAQCGRTVATPQYSDDVPRLILEGGSVYPDYLQFCGAGKQMFLVSEKVLNLFDENKDSGYSEPQPIFAETISLKKCAMPIPNYYSLRITGRIDLDTAAMHLKKKKTCPKCNQFEWSRMRLEPLLPDPATWDGSDLCLLSSIPGYRLCTDRVKKLIVKQKLTGFSFKAQQDK